MKLVQLINSKSSLENLINSKIPIGIAWELKVFTEKVSPELMSFDAMRNSKIIEYGEKLEDGSYKVKPENIDVFLKEINELAEKELEISVPEIKKDDLIKFKDRDGNQLLMTVEDLSVLSWLIKD